MITTKTASYGLLALTLLMGFQCIVFSTAATPIATSTIRLETMTEAFPADPATADCSDLFKLQVACQEGHCDVKRGHRGVCHAMLFQYHGGPCRSSSRSSPLATCQDLTRGSANNADDPEPFIVISALGDPNIVYHAGHTRVGEYFKISAANQQRALGDYYNVTIYSSNATSFETMSQTMIMFSPCEEDIAPTLSNSIQLVGTAMHPEEQHVDLELLLVSVGAVSYEVDSLSVATTMEPSFHNLTEDVQGRAVGTGEILLVSYSMPFQEKLTTESNLSVLATVGVTTDFGRHCHVNGLLDQQLF